VEEWKYVLSKARPDLPDSPARVMVRSVDAMTLAMCNDNSGVEREVISRRATEMALNTLLGVLPSLVADVADGWVASEG
jgi:hypothetical protein